MLKARGGDRLRGADNLSTHGLTGIACLCGQAVHSPWGGCIAICSRGRGVRAPFHHGFAVGAAENRYVSAEGFMKAGVSVGMAVSVSVTSIAGAMKGDLD